MTRAKPIWRPWWSRLKLSECSIDLATTSRGIPSAQYQVVRKPCTASRSIRAGSVLIVDSPRVHSVVICRLVTAGLGRSPRPSGLKSRDAGRGACPASFRPRARELLLGRVGRRRRGRNGAAVLLEIAALLALGPECSGVQDLELDTAVLGLAELGGVGRHRLARPVALGAELGRGD